MNFNLFEPPEITEQDNKVLLELFKNPVLNKYLHTLAAEEARSMVLSLNALEIGTEVYMRNQFYHKGKIDTLSSLLNIQQIAVIPKDEE